MRLFINGEERPGEVPGETVAAVLAGIQEQVRAGGATIMAVCVDGVPLEVSRPADEIAVREVARLDVEVATYRTLAAESLSEACRYIPRLRGALAEAGAALHAGDWGEGLDLFQRCLDGLGWVGRLLDAIAGLPAELRAGWPPAAAAAPFAVQGERWLRALEGCHEALAAEDFVLLADRCEVLARELQAVADLAAAAGAALAGDESGCEGEA